ncbi:MAG: outer membrane lipoprotein carrier protein LolA [Haloferacaceae archaeon]
MSRSSPRPLAFVLAFVLLTAGCAALGGGPTDEEVAARLAEGPSVDTVEGTYEVTETVGGETTRATVRVWTDADGRIRRVVNRSDGPRRVVVANASRTWVYRPSSGRAYRRGFTVLDRTGVQAYSYAALVGNLDAYRVEYRGRATVAGQSTYHVALSPAPNGPTPPDIEFYTYHIGARPDNVTVRPTHVELWLDTETWFPLKHELRVGDADAPRFAATVAYRNVTFNDTIPAERFSFDATRPNVDVVLDDVATVYRPFDRVARAEARAGVAYDVPATVGDYRRERVAVVETAAGRGIKAVYLPSEATPADGRVRVTRPTHPAAVAVVVSPDGTYRDLTGLPALDGEPRTLAGVEVAFARLPGHWVEVTFACDGLEYTVVGNEAVATDDVRRFVAAVGCA